MFSKEVKAKVLSIKLTLKTKTNNKDDNEPLLNPLIKPMLFSTVENFKQNNDYEKEVLDISNSQFKYCSNDQMNKAISEDLKKNLVQITSLKNDKVEVTEFTLHDYKSENKNKMLNKSRYCFNNYQPCSHYKKKSKKIFSTEELTINEYKTHIFKATPLNKNLFNKRPNISYNRGEKFIRNGKIVRKSLSANFKSRKWNCSTKFVSQPVPSFNYVAIKKSEKSLTLSLSPKLHTRERALNRKNKTKENTFNKSLNSTSIIY